MCLCVCVFISIFHDSLMMVEEAARGAGDQILAPKQPVDFPSAHQFSAAFVDQRITSFSHTPGITNGTGRKYERLANVKLQNTRYPYESHVACHELLATICFLKWMHNASISHSKGL